MAIVSDKSLSRRSVLRVPSGDGAPEAFEDVFAVEEPLEIRVSGDPVAITMRTPGDDHRLAAGFLYAEGIIRGAEDLGTIAHCGRPGEEGYGNVIDCAPAPGVQLEVDKVQASRRGTLTTSACGVCGRRSVEDLLHACGPIDPGPVLSREVVANATGQLEVVQRLFEQTGGTHAAMILDAGGEPLAGFEDVGRHNAVDKAVGELVLRGLTAGRPGVAAKPPEIGTPAILVVSGRASFEIVQKAAMARIPVVVSVSAASSLAVALGDELNVTLVTFARRGAMNVCTHAERLGL